MDTAYSVRTLLLRRMANPATRICSKNFRQPIALLQALFKIRETSNDKTGYATNEAKMRGSMQQSLTGNHSKRQANPLKPMINS